jgi:hypothetical protein
VNDEAGLRTALATATSGTVIYLEPTGNFQLTGTFPILVPEGVTIASNRGALVEGVYSEGALIAVDSGSVSANVPVFDTNASGVRFSSLRFEGPYGIIDESYTQVETVGIRARSGASNIEIDNIEIYGWTNAAIYLKGAQHAYVHHNHIHRNHHQHFYTNTSTGSGASAYGIVLYDDADALIEANIFDYNRHSIAGHGEPGQSYEARYNIVQQHLAAHAFDMHQFTGPANAKSAGNEIYIHHNTFLTTQASTGVINGTTGSPSNLIATGVDIRDKPTGCAWIEYNVFADSDIPPNAKVIRQENSVDNFAPNYNAFGTTSLLSANGVTGEWRPVQPAPASLSTMRIGDFDGDGRDDLFKLDGDDWMVAPGGNGLWANLNSTSSVLLSGTLALSDLRFGDFDGDGRTDIFFAKPIEGTDYFQWTAVSSDENRTVLSLASSIYPLADLRFADIDHDGTTDVFHVRSNGQWEISSGGTAPWKVVYTPTTTPATPVAAVAQLAFGDFNGDGKTDVFYATGTSGNQWSYFDYDEVGETGAWHSLASSGYTAGDLLLGDFNGDGKTDVLSYQSGEIKISSGAAVPWVSLNKVESGMTIGTSGVADFNGDGRAELLWKGTPGRDQPCTSAGCPLY